MSKCSTATDEDSYTYLECGSAGNLVSEYVLSLHWTLATILNVGYGDVVLSSSAGLLYSTLVMVVGSLICGYVLGMLLEKSGDTTPAAVEKRLHMAELGVYLREKGIPRSIVSRLWDHVVYYYAKAPVLRGQRGFMTAPVNLRMEVMQSLNSPVTKLNLWANSPRYLSQVMHTFHPYLVEPGEVIVGEEDYCVDVFFVLSGRVHGHRTHRLDIERDLSVLVSIHTPGGDFGTANAMHVEKMYWAAHSAAQVTELLWLDTTGLAMKEFPWLAPLLSKRAKQEHEDHDRVVSFMVNTVSSSSDHSLSAPFVVLNDSVVPAQDAWNGSFGSETSMARASISLALSNEASDKSSEPSTYRVARSSGETASRDREYVVELETSLEMLRRGIINPYSRWKVDFDLMIVVCTVLTIITSSLRIGFDIKNSEAWHIYDVLIDVIFLVDIFFGFITAFEQPDFTLNTDHRSIASRYLRGWFAIDLASGFPFSFLLSQSGLQLLKFLKIVRIVRVIRIVKVLRASRLLKVLKYSQRGDVRRVPFSNLRAQTMKFLQMFFGICLFTHVFACGWARLTLKRDDGQTWSDSERSRVSDDLYSKYIAAVYWIFTTSTSVGYGDIVPENDAERIYALFVMLIGCLVVAFFVSQVAEAEKDENIATARHANRATLIREYINDQTFPVAMQSALLKHFSHTTVMRSAYPEVEMWERMPHTIRVLVSSHSHSIVIEQFPNVFSPFAPSISYTLLKYFEPCFVPQDAYVFNYESGSGGVYLLCDGDADVIDEHENGEERLCGTLKPGDIMGVEYLRGEELSYVGIRAATDLSMYKLSIRNSDALRSDHPGVASQLDSVLKNSLGAVDAAAARSYENIGKLTRSYGQRGGFNYGSSVMDWVLNDDDSSSYMPYIRCIIDDCSSDKEREEIIEATKKRSPSLTLSYSSRREFLQSKERKSKC
eukprot:CAMPEP_0185040618 /NCGR_PEP_ID=MMETSP1103-20130426/38884_1 /TAXON_ID=36769 /ORGANISM="Paraphysomonas bandaiensis, Strain Caron Lab Isolate" /LENGTH=940 /DNA_ID=CAMNT_0027579995 /DNA_START=676 /DNA_END=3498 /DNA_ORIENTATION=+